MADNLQAEVRKGSPNKRLGEHFLWIIGVSWFHVVECNNEMVVSVDIFTILWISAHHHLCYYCMSMVTGDGAVVPNICAVEDH